MERFPYAALAAALPHLDWDARGRALSPLSVNRVEELLAAVQAGRELRVGRNGMLTLKADHFQ